MRRIKEGVLKKFLYQDPKTNAPITLNTLQKAWNDLPPDFSSHERSLFIEIAERIIKVEPGNTN